ncbi:permease [Paucibacter sp. KBW04]|uniref:lipase family alpha/beta hydrolase n=1 Tax=Paucibacter sp. KBW04 TaxID=2153361 RepID=UPI000F56073D|nr:alpha/beta hydrolase [Paucibacter sp. KBW04]RQO57313.1 permease [Paucibacter sp. KBW04]
MSKSHKRTRHLQPSDARALSQLAVQATAGLTRVVEGVHQSVWDRLGLPGPAKGRTGGITGLVYRSIYGATEMLGRGLDRALSGLEPWLAKSLNDELGREHAPTPEREAVLAALNGIMGDHLLESKNPLASGMSLRWQAQVLQSGRWPSAHQVGPRILLLMHGLCMNERAWMGDAAPGHIDAADSPEIKHGGHVAALCAAGRLNPVYLRYNSGLHISQNGHRLAAALEQLLGGWPRPLEEIRVLAHSMGGLLIRSAVHSAQSQGMAWPERVSRVVFLGTPHHGAPLERAGHWLDVLLGSSSFTAPLAKLGQLRSAGITDLRHGNVLDADWQGYDRFHPRPDQRQPLPLPEGVDCYTIAATTASRSGSLSERLIGDGLVTLNSALGQHEDPSRNLHFPASQRWLAYKTNHMELLDSPRVTEQLLKWLA